MLINIEYNVGDSLYDVAQQHRTRIAQLEEKFISELLIKFFGRNPTTEEISKCSKQPSSELFNYNLMFDGKCIGRIVTNITEDRISSEVEVNFIPS